MHKQINKDTSVNEINSYIAKVTSMSDPILQYSSLVDKLNKLLELDLISSGNNAVLKLPIKSIIEIKNNDDIIARKIEFARLLQLVRDLYVIKVKKPELLKTVIKKTKRNYKNFDNWVGLRFEINILSALIDKNIAINYSDALDINIQYKKNQLFIECGSVHILNNKNKDYLYKINSVLNKKIKSSYANFNTALFIDITNYAHITNININLDLNNLREYIKTSFNINPYGSVVLLTYLININLNRIESPYIRLDNPKIELNLKRFLNNYYRINPYLIEDFKFPSEG